MQYLKVHTMQTPCLVVRCHIYPFGTIYVISEGEECVRADSHCLQGADPVLLFSL